MELLERDAECAALGALLRELSSGRGGLAVLAGPSGVGKSALLDWLTARCTTTGTSVVSARATELGGAVAFGLARRLLEPRVRSDPSLIASGWARRCSPLFGGEHPGSGVTAPIVEGLLEVVAALVERDGQFVVVADDIQWADPASLAFLLELGDRRTEIGAGLAVAINTGEPAADPTTLDALRALAVSEEITPGGLSLAAVRKLARIHAPESSEDALHRLTQATGGNPLLVMELLADASLEDDALLVSDGLAKLVLRRLARVAPDARALARALAVLGDAPLRLVAELAELERSAADAAADALVASHIVALGDRLRFAHPILGEAVLATTAPFELAARHRHAAELLADDGADDERVAPHLMRSRPAGDVWTWQVLARAARISLEHGDPGTAARQLERAIQEPPPLEERAGTALALASARAAAGQPAAIPEFENALRHLVDPTRRAEAWHRLSRLLFARGDATRAADSAVRARAELPEGHPLRERLLADELSATSLLPATSAAAAARTEALALQDPPSDPNLLAQIIVHSSWRGIHVDRLPRLARAAVTDDPLVDHDSGGFALSYVAGALNMIDETPLSCELLDAGLRRAAARGDPLAEASLRCCRAWARIYQGQLALARTDLDAVLRASRLGWPAAEALSGPPLIVLALELGDVDAAAAALRRTQPSQFTLGMPWFTGAVALAAGDLAHALREFERAGEELEGQLGMGNPGVLPWRASAALAAGRLGDRERARALLEPALERAATLGIPRALGIAQRVAGVVDDDLPMLERSVAVLESSPARLELARSLMSLGVGYRRARRARDARGPLDRARELARACGAAGLAERTVRELRAAGARPTQRPRVGVRALTPSERNVAELAASGLTTREIAHELYVTPKTVEGHLTRIFRKLNIDSRSELEGKLVSTSGSDPTDRH